jgi:hypothetical protein
MTVARFTYLDFRRPASNYTAKPTAGEALPASIEAALLKKAEGMAKYRPGLWTAAPSGLITAALANPAG